MTLPANYRIKPEDVGKAFEIYFVRDDATDEERAVAETIIDAEEMHQQTGGWPTYAEAYAYGWKKADEYWQRNFGRNAPREKEK